MKRRLKGILNDFINHLALLAEDPKTDPFYVLAEHDLTDLRKTKYWNDLERIADAHGICNVPLHVIIPEIPPVERCPLHAMAAYTRTAREQKIDIVLTDGKCSAEGSLILTRFGLKTVLEKQKKPPHPDCGPPGWIEGREDVKNIVALITKLCFYPTAAELLEDLPVDVYGVGMPGRTSLALLQKYRRVLYIDDLDPCGTKRYLEWKKLICPEYLGIKVEWLRGTDFKNFKIDDYDQWFLIKDELLPPELEEEARFLAAEMIAELEEVASNVPEQIVSATKGALQANQSGCRSQMAGKGDESRR